MLMSNKFAREGPMVLYRGLVKDQLNASRKNSMIRQQEFSYKRERMRALEILSLLPGSCSNSKQGRECDGNGRSNHERRGQKKRTKRKGGSETGNSSSAIGPSPYQSKSKTRKTRKNKTNQLQRTRIQQMQEQSRNNERKASRRLLPRDADEYIWHPVVVENRHKKKEVVQDIMKFYSSQYHRTGQIIK
jgi:hypothetical protein